MKRHVPKTLVLTLVLLAAPAWGADKVRIVTGFEQPTKCISKVQVNNIDGKEVRVPAQGFEVEAGVHTFTGRAVVNTRFCRTIGNRNTVQEVNPLEAEFETGKVYYVSYDHSSEDRDDWGLVMWKIEDD